MNVKELLFSLLRSWWIVLIAVVVTTGSTVYFGLQRDPVYQSSAAVELMPSPSLGDAQMISIINVLSNRRTAINTYARKATSSAVRDQVATKLGIKRSVVDAAGITAFVLPETTLIEIRANANNAQLAADICNAVAQEMILLAPDKVMIFEQIDYAEPTNRPTEPQPSRLFTLGAVTGIVLGLAFAFGLYLLQLYLRIHARTQAEVTPQILASSASK